MPDQRLDHAFTDPSAPPDLKDVSSFRLLPLLIAPLFLCATLAYLLLPTPYSASGPSVWLLGFVVLIPFYWDSVTAVIALLGLRWMPRQTNDMVEERQTPLTIAMLVLLYDETPEPIIERAFRLASSVATAAPHAFSLHVLSDSRHAQSVQRERATFHALKNRYPHLLTTYAHREANTDYKSGNIRAWIMSSGHAHDAMLVLDADSVMEAQSIIAMANALASDHACALVQSIPRVLPGRTIWQSMQSFASHYYGGNLGRGLALVSGSAANYYGHNALLRIKAFATSAGLPHLSGPPPFGGVIMSHDFVEAALLRRAGWSVRFLPELTGSYEDTPDTLIAFLGRDKRWCHGNLQHLNLIKVPGLTIMSRFHLLHGAMSYLSAPFWLMALLLWATMPVQLETNAWLSSVALIASVLLLPRICGLLSQPDKLSSTDLFFAAKELTLSSLIAPTLMVQRTRMIAAILLGKTSAWNKPETRDNSLGMQMCNFAGEVLLGSSLLAAWASGLFAPIILTAALPLVLAPVLAYVVSQHHQHLRWRPSR
jgi:membrane glycosyltransferase